MLVLMVAGLASKTLVHFIYNIIITRGVHNFFSEWSASQTSSPGTSGEYQEMVFETHT